MLRIRVAPARLGCVVLGAWGAAVGFPSPLAAQTPQREPAVVELPASARALGLGHAFQSDAPDPDAVFYDPALASLGQGFALGIHWLTDAARSYTASAAGSWLGGGVALGLRTLEYGTPFAPGERAGGIDPLLGERIGSETPGGARRGVAEMVATLAFGRTFKGLRIGVAGKLIDQRLGSVRRQDLAADVGVSRSLGPGRASLAVRNLGPDATLGGVDVRLPTDVSLRWGAYGRPVGPVDVGGAAALTRRADGELVAGGGLEVGYWPIQGRTFVARVGFVSVPEGEARPVTFGGSFWGDQVVLDYAFQPVEGTDGVHRLTLGWR